METEYTVIPNNTTDEALDTDESTLIDLVRSGDPKMVTVMEGRAYAKPLNMLESMIDYILTTSYSNQNVEDILNYGCWCQIDKCVG